MYLVGTCRTVEELENVWSQRKLDGSVGLFVVTEELFNLFSGEVKAYSAQFNYKFVEKYNIFILVHRKDLDQCIPISLLKPS